MVISVYVGLKLTFCNLSGDIQADLLDPLQNKPVIILYMSKFVILDADCL